MVLRFETVGFVIMEWISEWCSVPIEALDRLILLST
jgi:hypothetical protein